MTPIKSKNEIVNYILKFAKTTNIDIFEYLPIEQNKDALIEFLFPNDKREMKAVDKIALILGINYYDLLCCNTDRIKDYIEDDVFFKHINKYKEVLNGNAENVFFNFPNIEEMVTSYCDLYETYIFMFKKLLKTDGKIINIECFNFLASVLGAYDIANPETELLNIGLMLRFKKIYNEEVKKYNLNDIFEFRSIKFLDLWRCTDFINNPNLINKLDHFAPNWRIRAQNKFEQFKQNNMDIFIINSDGSKELLSEQDKEVLIQKLQNVLKSTPATFKNNEERIAYSLSTEYQNRSHARANSKPVMLPNTFDIFDFFEAEFGLDSYLTEVFLDAQSEFERITNISENEDPEEYEYAMLTYVAGAMGWNYDSVLELYEAQIEFNEIY
jgi:hypothetical protein